MIARVPKPNSNSTITIAALPLPPQLPTPGDGVVCLQHPVLGRVALKYGTAEAFSSYETVVKELRSLYLADAAYRSSFALEVSEGVAFDAANNIAITRWIEGIPMDQLKTTSIAETHRLDRAMVACLSLVRLAIMNAEGEHGCSSLFYDAKGDNILYCGERDGLPVLCPIDFTLTPAEASVKSSRAELLHWK